MPADASAMADVPASLSRLLTAAASRAGVPPYAATNTMIYFNWEHKSLRASDNYEPAQLAHGIVPRFALLSPSQGQSSMRNFILLHLEQENAASVAFHAFSQAALGADLHNATHVSQSLEQALYALRGINKIFRKYMTAGSIVPSDWRDYMLPFLSTDDAGKGGVTGAECSFVRGLDTIFGAPEASNADTHKQFDIASASYTTQQANLMEHLKQAGSAIRTYVPESTTEIKTLWQACGDTFLNWRAMHYRRIQKFVHEDYHTSAGNTHTSAGGVFNKLDDRIRDFGSANCSSVSVG
ncbi:unnamed protein product [Prorocentrum cordatum]|uniref:Uncharacterized protein n=1 Tax=Prorocentrum cordatum TaxID=2364126 RepID=A0ABN9WWU3_9DINO|nr:unnamed protein product [Polarella glacialis]